MLIIILCLLLATIVRVTDATFADLVIQQPKVLLHLGFGERILKLQVLGLFFYEGGQELFP